MDIYLAGAPVDRLFDEVTCGDVGVQGVKIIIPSDRYDSFIARLAGIDSTNYFVLWQLHRFLAYRCDREFLERYIANYSEFVHELRVRSYLKEVSDMDLLVRLHEVGLLSESKRAEVAQAIGQLAIETPDTGFLCEGIRELLKVDEFALIIEGIRTKLLPELDSTIYEWQSNYDSNSDQDPEDHFYDLVRALETFSEELVDDSDAQSQIKSAMDQIKDIIEELRSDRPLEPDSDDFFRQSSGGADAMDSRSVFDDVDQ